MKLATSRLKEIIREEIAAIREDVQYKSTHSRASREHGRGPSAMAMRKASVLAAPEKIIGAAGQELEPKSRVSRPAEGNGTIIRLMPREEGRFKGKMMAVVKWDNDPESRGVAPGILHPETR